jgi:hypothetical protein
MTRLRQRWRSIPDKNEDSEPPLWLSSKWHLDDELSNQTILRYYFILAVQLQRPAPDVELDFGSCWQGGCDVKRRVNFDVLKLQLPTACHVLETSYFH